MSSTATTILAPTPASHRKPRGRALQISLAAVAGILLGTSCALVTALVADQFQRRQNRLQRAAGTQYLAGVPPAHRAEDRR